MRKLDMNTGLKPKRKVKKILRNTACVILVLVLIGGLMFSYDIGQKVANGLLFQNAENDTKANSIKQLKKWGYDVKGFEDTYKGEKFTISAEDGNVVPVTSYSVDNNSNKNTVILVHGAGGDYVSTYPQAEIYLKNNWNVITFDQRASGDSENKLVTFGVYEKLDVKAIVDYVREKAPDKKLVVHGFSMGAATTGLYTATDHAYENINYAVLDSSFDSMESMFLGVWHEMKVEIPDDYVIFCGNWYLNQNYGFKFDDADVVAALAKDKVPTLVIQGTKDELCTQDMGEKIYEAIKSKDKEYWLVDSAHIEASIDDPAEYEEKVMGFLGK